MVEEAKRSAGIDINKPLASLVSKHVKSSKGIVISPQGRGGGFS